MNSAAKKQDQLEKWRLLPIKEFAHTTSGGTPKRGVSEFYNGDVPWVKSGDLNDSQLNSCDEFISQLGLEKSSAKLFKPGTVLIALYGATIGRLSILGFEASTNQAVCGITLPENVDVKYLFYYLLSIRRKLIAQGKGGAQPNINQQIVKETIVPLAPYEQQKRIVAKIEELFSHIDAGIEALKKAKQLLKQYRQSVLKAAVTGELTKEWREANKAKLEPAAQLLERILKERRQKWEEQQLEQFKAKGKMPKNDKWKEKYKEIPLPESSDLPLIPEEWEWLELQHVFDVITDGDHQAPPKSDSGVPFLVIGNVNKGVLNFNDTRYVPRSYFDGLSEIRKPRKDDLLYTVVGSYGIPVKVDTNEEFCVQRHIAILKPSKGICVDFLYYILSSGFVFKQATDVSTGTAQKTVPLGGLRKIKIPLPPVTEQKEMVRLIDEKLLAMKRLANESDNKMLMADKNKQSILASAFSGQLLKNHEGSIEKIASIVA